MDEAGNPYQKKNKPKKQLKHGSLKHNFVFIT